MSKYKNRKITVNGLTFDSKQEYQRWCELQIRLKAGEISGLQRQVKYELLPSQYGYIYTPKGKKRRCIERPVYYIADFVYYDKNGERVVEDSKGYRTKDYILKRKMMLYLRGIQIKEV